MSIALSSVANTANLMTTAQWVQTTLPATGPVVPVTPHSRVLWQKWRALPSNPATAIGPLQQFITQTTATWAHQPVSLASVELVLVASQQLESDEALLNGATASGIPQAALWRQVGLQLPAQWATFSSAPPGSSGAHATVSAAPFFTMAAQNPDGEIPWTIHARPDTAMAVTVVALHQLSQALGSFLALKDALQTMPALAHDVAQLPQDLVHLRRLLVDPQAATTTWQDLQALQTLWDVPSATQSTGSALLTTATAIVRGRAAFPLHAVWESARYGALSGTRLIQDTGQVTTDSVTNFPHSTVWVAGAPFQPARIPLTPTLPMPPVVTVTLPFPLSVFWDNMALDTTTIVFAAASDLLTANTADTLGLSLLVTFGLPVVQRHVTAVLTQRLRAAEHQIRTVPVVGPNAWVLPTTIDQALAPHGAWAGMVWPVSPRRPEAFVEYFDSALGGPNFALVSPHGRVLWRYQSTGHTPVLSPSQVAVWVRPQTREAVVSLTISGFAMPNRALWLFRWAPGVSTPQVFSVNAPRTVTTPMLPAYHQAIHNIVSSFANMPGLADVQVGPHGTVYVESLNALAGIPGVFTIAPQGTAGWALSSNTVSATNTLSPPLPGSVGTLLPYPFARHQGSDLMLGVSPLRPRTPVALWTHSTLQGRAAGVGQAPAPQALMAAQQWVQALAQGQYRQAWALMTPTFRRNPGWYDPLTAGYFDQGLGWGSLRYLEASHGIIAGGFFSQASSLTGLTAQGLVPEAHAPHHFTEPIRQVTSSGAVTGTLTLHCVPVSGGWLVNSATVFLNPPTPVTP
ncbi:hypothetical protein CO251_00915 [Sulfobacillus sp. hq2]|nr:hypothetical protein CO251_00915 [Sulfobacillus sp. hq2]